MCRQTAGLFSEINMDIKNAVVKRLVKDEGLSPILETARIAPPPNQRSGRVDLTTDDDVVHVRSYYDHTHDNKAEVEITGYTPARTTLEVAVDEVIVDIGRTLDECEKNEAQREADRFQALADAAAKLPQNEDDLDDLIYDADTGTNDGSEIDEDEFFYEEETDQEVVEPENEAVEPEPEVMDVDEPALDAGAPPGLDEQEQELDDLYNELYDEFYDENGDLFVRNKPSKDAATQTWLQ